MLRDKIARDVVKTCIRLVGGLVTGDHVRLQDKLDDLRVKTIPQLNQLRVRISEMVGNLDPPYKLDIGFLGGVDRATKVIEIVEIVSRNSERK